MLSPTLCETYYCCGHAMAVIGIFNWVGNPLQAELCLLSLGQFLETISMACAFSHHQRHYIRMPVIQRPVGAGLSGIESLCLAQSYTYMSERGHAYGALSDDDFTWMLYADRRGNLLVSNVIPCEQRSGPDRLSVTAVGSPHSWPLL